MLALSIFYHSRKAYKMLNRIVALPSESTLKLMLSKSNIRPGFHDNIFEALEKRVATFDDQDKQCAIVLDEMAIKSGLSYDATCDGVEGTEDYGHLGQTKYMANHALAIIVRGLSQKWKQCIGHFLSSGTISGDKLKDITFNAIQKLSDIGLNVHVLVCDQGANNRNFLSTILDNSVDKPYFECSDRKIFVIYDPPHLLKNIRNNFKKHGFVHGDDSIQWEHVVNFYNFDRRGGIRMAPKLTEQHIYLPMFTKMRVRLAAQVLSHSVTAGITTLARLNHLPMEALSTATFIENMDQLFNTFNSSTFLSKQKFGHAITNDSGHIEFLKQMDAYLKELHVPDKRQIHCINGWRISINSLMLFWHHLHTQFKFRFLLTNRLNQDCVENLFSIIVRHAGLLWSQQDFEWHWSVPLFKCLTVLEFSFILFDLCLLITFFNFIMNYVPIVTFWIFGYHKIWILSIMFCFIWSYWIINFLACLEVSWRVVS